MNDKITPYRVTENNINFSTQKTRKNKNKKNFSELKLLTRGEIKLNENQDDFICKFINKQESMDVFILTFELRDLKALTGANISISLSGWKELSYIAFGFVADSEFKHIKIAHPRQDHKFLIEFSIYDLAYRLQNNFITSKLLITKQIKLFLKGIPSKKHGYFKINQLNIFKETTDTAFYMRMSRKKNNFLDISHWFSPSTFLPPIKKLCETLFAYDSKNMQAYKTNAQYFLQGKGLSISKYADLPVAPIAKFEDVVNNNISLRYAYHALNPVNTLLMLHEKEGNLSALVAARDLMNEWLQDNFFSKTNDLKYAWYDHGTAERQMVFLRMWKLSLEVNFDIFFMGKLLYVIYKQAVLLASESFYARDQNYRYHNHALFQDLALLATALGIPQFAAASFWKKTALERLNDQFSHLIIQEKEFAVLKENSTGYHGGVMRIVSFLVSMLKNTGNSHHYSQFNELLNRMQHFETIITYPDGRLPAIGDTFRLENTEKSAKKGRLIRKNTSFVGLNKAGYAIANGKENDMDFQFTFYATSLNKTHKHTDNLAFTLFFDGIEWLIDPSFYSHQYTDAFPTYLRGPSAHNAPVLVNEATYSLEPNITELSTSFIPNGEFTITGQHAAYPNCVISRNIKGTLNNLLFSFTDQISHENKDTKAQLMYHLGESIEAVIENDCIVLSSTLSKQRLLLTPPTHGKITLFKGTEQSIDKGVGWSGTGFCKAVPIQSISIDVPVNTVLEWSIKVI